MLKAVQFAAAELKGDREIVPAVVAQDGLALQYAATELKGDREPHLTNLCSRLDFNGYFARLYSSGGAGGEGGSGAGTQRGLVSSVYRQT